MPQYTCNKQQIIDRAVSTLRHALELWLDENETYGGLDLQVLDSYQSMHWRGELEIFKPDEEEQ